MKEATFATTMCGAALVRTIESDLRGRAEERGRPGTKQDSGLD